MAGAKIPQPPRDSEGLPAALDDARAGDEEKVRFRPSCGGGHDSLR